MSLSITDRNKKNVETGERGGVGEEKLEDNEWMRRKWKKMKQGSRRPCRKILGEEGRKNGYMKMIQRCGMGHVKKG